MKTKKLLLSVVLVIWCSTSTAQASKSTLFTDCYSSIDTVGCFLNLAKQKALSNKDKKQQAEQAGKVLSYLGHLNRTDFELVSSAAAIANDKSLGIEEYLDLQIALATYFIERDEEQAKKHLSNASKLFATALETDRPTDRSALYRWSCGLIDQHPLIWRQVAYITASTCTLKRIGEIEVKELTDEVLVALQKIDATWVQSDFEGMESQREIFSSKLKELEAIGIKAKSKSINETTQYFKVLALLSVADRYRRSGQRVEADKTLAQAQEALVGLEKINDGKFSLSARIMLADHHNGFLEFSKARDTLKPVVTKFSSPNALSKIDSEDQVELLVTLAYAIDAGGFLSQSEAIGSRSERQIRQADVLYEKYKIFSRLDKSKDVPSEATLRALHDAAEAGHQLAMHNLGVAYRHGLYGITKNLARARYWYYWSAISGFAGAQNNLGDLYETSEDTEPDIGMALYWYTQAAMQGEPTAYLSRPCKIHFKPTPSVDLSFAVG